MYPRKMSTSRICIICIFGLILTFSAYEVNCSCDKLSCNAGEICISHINGGTCMKISDLHACGSIIGCPEGSRCGDDSRCYSDKQTSAKRSNDILQWRIYQNIASKIVLVLGLTFLLWALVIQCVTNAIRTKHTSTEEADMPMCNSRYSYFE